ncbi:MAG: hypothetical protein N3B18_09740 [Desulfobacterota bacterium]|nr:hypothetical protein [Thermodesulfobacteriota bacterium]
MIEQSHTPRNISKATIRCEQRDGHILAVKDYSGRTGLMKRYGRLTLKNELRAYLRLRGIVGIPVCFGLRTPDVLELQYINAVPLSRMKPGAVAESVFDRLQEIVATMHARGVANTDIHRSNVLVAENGDVYLVDFAHALIARCADRPGILVRLGMELDRYACARIRARYLQQPAPAPAGLFGLLYRGGSLLKKTLKGIKRIVRMRSG